MKLSSDLNSLLPKLVLTQRFHYSCRKQTRRGASCHTSVQRTGFLMRRGRPLSPGTAALTLPDHYLHFSPFVLGGECTRKLQEVNSLSCVCSQGKGRFPRMARKGMSTGIYAGLPPRSPSLLRPHHSSFYVLITVVWETFQN